MKQDHGENVIDFSSRVQKKAANCSFKRTGKCTCNANVEVDFTEDVVKQVVLAGLYESETKKKVLSQPEIDTKSLSEVTGVIETEEMTLRAVNSDRGTTTGQTSYKSDKSDQRLKQTAKCTTCGNKFLPNRIKNDKIPDKFCKTCYLSIACSYRAK